VVLLDDLASELDPGRKRRVIEQLDRDWQVFLTTTRREDFSSQTSFDAIIEFEKPGCPILKEEDL
jgi:recombinational DNA repair ATPase RecF